MGSSRQGGVIRLVPSTQLLDSGLRGSVKVLFLFWFQALQAGPLAMGNAGLMWNHAYKKLYTKGHPAETTVGTQLAEQKPLQRSIKEQNSNCKQVDQSCVLAEDSLLLEWNQGTHQDQTIQSTF